MSNILKFFLLIFFCCLILFSYLLNLNDNVYKKPKDYSIVHSKIKCPEKIKHFPNAIPIEAKNIKLYGHTTKNNDERLLLEFSIDKEYIIKELKNHDFINKNTKIGEPQEIYYMQQIGHDIKNYTFYVINDPENLIYSKSFFPYFSGIGIDLNNSKILYYYISPSD